MEAAKEVFKPFCGVAAYGGSYAPDCTHTDLKNLVSHRLSLVKCSTLGGERERVRAQQSALQNSNPHNISREYLACAVCETRTREPSSIGGARSRSPQLICHSRKRFLVNIAIGYGLLLGWFVLLAHFWLRYLYSCCGIAFLC